MNIFIKVLRYLGVFYHNLYLWNPFGFKVLNLIWYKYKAVIQNKDASFCKEVHCFLYNYLVDKYGKYIVNEETIIGNANHTIWIYWWQGLELMPLIVKQCYRSVLANANGAKVQLITKDNYRDFIDVPAIMLEKQAKGVICHAHFSDIYRCCLLYKYGGLWLDATILVTQQISPEIFNLDFYTMKKKPTAVNSVNSHYSSFCFGCKPGNILFKNLSILFLEYVKTEKYFVDYFVFDYFIQIISNTLPEVKQMIDTHPYNNPGQIELQLHFNSIYRELWWNELMSNGTLMHKLTYKGKLYESVDGKETVYGHILNLKY